MTSLLRPLTFVGLLALTAVSLLPPWEICWHPDGSACLEVETAPCCDEGRPGSETEPEPCSDCADTSNVDTALQDGRAQVLHLLATPPASLAARVSPERDVECEGPRLPALGPPDTAPPGLMSRPIRC